MSARWYVEVVIENLKRVQEYAKKAGLGEHFQSELKHLVATAEANREKEDEEDGSH